jgi:hypothetical protein
VTAAAIAIVTTGETLEVFMGSTFDDELHNLTTHLQIKAYKRSQFSQSFGSVREPAFWPHRRRALFCRHQTFDRFHHGPLVVEAVA